LSAKQKARLIESGVAESEIVTVGKGKYKRTSGGYCPKREDWDDIKAAVMLTALRINNDSLLTNHSMTCLVFAGSHAIQTVHEESGGFRKTCFLCGAHQK